MAWPFGRRRAGAGAEVRRDRPTGPVKSVYVVNTGLKMGKGKLAAQVGHAAVKLARQVELRHPAMDAAWRMGGEAKVVVKASDAEALAALRSEAEAAGLLTAVVRDAGRTQIPSGSLTVLGIGPGEADAIDAITGELTLL